MNEDGPRSGPYEACADTQSTCLVENSLFPIVPIEAPAMKLPQFKFTVRQLMAGVAVLAVLLFVGLRLVQRQRQLSKAAQVRYATSLAVYQGYGRLFLAGEISLLPVYECSLRVREAQRDTGDSAWAVDHLKRMQAVQKYFASLPGNACPTPETLLLKDHMIREAECWVLRETW